MALHAAHRAPPTRAPCTPSSAGSGSRGPYARGASSPLVDWASGGYLYLTGEPAREPLQGGGPWASYLTGATAAVGSPGRRDPSRRAPARASSSTSARWRPSPPPTSGRSRCTPTPARSRDAWGLRFGEAYHPMGLLPLRRRELDHRRRTEPRPVGELLHHRRRGRAARRRDAVRSRRRASSGPTRSTPPSRRGSPSAPPTRPSPSCRPTGCRPAGCSTSPRCCSPSSSPPAACCGARAGPRPGRPHASSDRSGRRGAAEPLAPPAPALGARHRDVPRRARASGVDRRRLPSIDLADVRVAEFSIAWAGPLAGRLLADLGADVVKVEHPASRGLGGSGRTPSGARRGRGASWPPPRCGPRCSPTPIPASTRGTAWASGTR